MATRAVTMNQGTQDSYQSHVAVWTGLLNTDDGAPVKMPESADRSGQVTGTFGAGGSLQWEGSNDITNPPTNWFLLHDPQGLTTARTAAGLVLIEEATLWIRPRVTAGDGTTVLQANLLLKKVA